MRPLVEEFFHRCMDIVVSQDGIVDYFLGDAVMALFNVPIRHEDHIARAVRSATEIQLAVPEINAKLNEVDMLKVGIGVSSGLAYCGTVGSTDCKDYTALGDAVNIASRLQGQAAPGEIIVDEPVYSKVETTFPDAPERLLELKGIKTPLLTYSLM